jgi:CheY-like chemotaxis protein
VFAVSPNVVLLEPDRNAGIELADELTDAGFDVVVTSSASKAEQALCAQQALALVAEVEFPGCQLVSFLDNLLKLRKLPRIVILMTSDSSFHASEAFRRGIDAVFTKPFSKQALKELLKESVRSQVSVQQRRISRVNTDFPIALNKAGEENSLSGSVMNLSQGGAFVEVHQGAVPEVGNVFEFEIVFPDESVVSGLGRVAWVRLLLSQSRRFGFGLEFDLNSPEIGQIFAAVNRLKTTSRAS